MAYARIEEGFWTDPKIKALPLEGKMVAAWLFTNPHRHFSGLYYLPIVLIPHEIGLSIGVSEKIFKLLEEQGFIKYSFEFSVVWVVTMLKHQSGGKDLSAQQITGIRNHLKTLHGCPLIEEFIERYQHLGVNYDGKIDTPINTPIDIKSQSQSQSKSKSKSNKDTPLPPDFEISDEVKEWATQKGYTRLDEHLESFKDYARSRGKTYVDWDSAFKRAIREDWAKIGGSNGSSRPLTIQPINKADQVTAGNLASAARLREKWKNKEQS